MVLSGYSKQIGTGEWIRDRLKVINEGYIWQIYKDFRRDFRAMGYKPGSYKNFCYYFRILSDLGLIELIRKEPAKKEGTKKDIDKLIKYPQLSSDRKYYRLAKEKIEDIAWQHPRKAWENQF